MLWRFNVLALHSSGATRPWDLEGDIVDDRIATALFLVAATATEWLAF